MKFTNVRDLKWLNQEHTAFDCIVDFETLGEVPFGCFQTDPYPHTQDIWARGLAGEFGVIAEYVEPVQPVIEATEPQPVVDGAQTL